MWQVIDVRQRIQEAEVISLIRAAAAAIYGENCARGLARAAEVATEYERSKQLHMWGIEQDSKVTGIIGVEPMPAGKLIIRDLAVASELRRKGAGRSMIEFVRRHYRPKVVSGHTWSGALEFYVRCGFTTCEDGALPSGKPRYAFEWRRT